MYYFTSVNANYLSKAILLAKTLKKHDKTAKFILALIDDLSEEFEIPDGLFDGILYTDQMPCWKNSNSVFFQYNVVEACTAVKPAATLAIMEQYNCDKVCYLDPDIAVFSPLVEVEELLDIYSMVFTPHTTIPEEHDYFIIGNEILFLKRGTQNLGFFAVKNDEEGRRFLNWWHARLNKYCLDDRDEIEKLLMEKGLTGMFTDQKWIDLVPSFFDNYYILKHPGYNLSTWNLSHRVVTKGPDESYYVNGLPLRFFHFSGVDSGAHSAVMDDLIRTYPHVKSVLSLSKWYIQEDKKIQSTLPQNVQWKYNCYSNGQKVPNIHRKLYYIRPDIKEIFENPFIVSDDKLSFYTWVQGEYPELATEGNIPVERLVYIRQPLYLRVIKKILLCFMKKDSRAYQKMKRIWKAFTS